MCHHCYHILGVQAFTFFRANIGSQKHWEEGIEISHVLPKPHATTHTLASSSSNFTTMKLYYIDTSLSSKVHSLHCFTLFENNLI